MGVKTKIFLSYANEDTVTVEELYEDLSKEKKFKPWIATKEISPGDEWPRSITDAIETCHFFLACLSKHSVDDKGELGQGQYNKEIGRALEMKQNFGRNLDILSVLLEPCQVPKCLSEYQYVNLFGKDKPKAMEKLVGAIREKMKRKPLSEIEYYVSLDLGSESMAAYYEKKNPIEGGMIHLQAHAKALLDGAEPEFLKDHKDHKDNGSPRLRTRILLKERFHPRSLSEEHATLKFVDEIGKKRNDYDEKSLFQYFLEKGYLFGVRKIMPNPKIPFQYGGKEIIPEIYYPENLQSDPKISIENTRKSFRPDPETLIQHLATQVVTNFILKSPELNGVESQKIHLTLTVPNVYSLIHVEKIKEFVAENAGILEVETMYESEAVAYFLYTPFTKRDFEKLNGLRQFRDRALNAAENGELRLVTIDIGRGTTDLSLIQIKKYEPANYNSHFVLARTGKSDGGNRLSYIFVEYYNDQLEYFLQNSPNLKNKEDCFNFITAKLDDNRLTTEQGRAILALEKLIEIIKRNVSESYEIRLKREDRDEQGKLIDQIINEVFHAIDATLQEKEWNTKVEYERPGKVLRDALILPEKLPLKLRTEIDKYVKENGVDLIKQLERLALSRENGVYRENQHRFLNKVFHPACTYFLIAGQASQFGPLRKAIENELRRRKLSSNYYFLSGISAKEACCKGAVFFQSTGHKYRNSRELHGTYGFRARNKPPFEPVDMIKIRNGGDDSIGYDKPIDYAGYCLIYSPRSSSESQKQKPEFDDGFTAVIKCFGNRDKFTVEYDPSNLEMRVDGSPIKQLETSYGGNLEPIYPKVWPEVLKSPKSKK